MNKKTKIGIVAGITICSAISTATHASTLVKEADIKQSITEDIKLEDIANSVVNNISDFEPDKLQFFSVTDGEDSRGETNKTRAKDPTPMSLLEELMRKLSGGGPVVASSYDDVFSSPDDSNQSNT